MPSPSHGFPWVGLGILSIVGKDEGFRYQVRSKERGQADILRTRIAGRVAVGVVCKKCRVSLIYLAFYELRGTRPVKESSTCDGVPVRAKELRVGAVGD